MHSRTTITAIIQSLCTSFIVVVIVGCATSSSQSRAPATTTLSYELPVVSSADTSKTDQEKDGIRVSVVPYQFNAKTVAYREYRDVPTLFVVKNQYRGETRQIPSVQIDPGNLRFKVRINNRLERVLRLAGAVVAYQVAGRTENVASSNYQEFLNGIILPRQEAEFDLGGPALSVLKDQTTMGLFIYDVVTATDAAGNPTQRSNFEWYFTVRMEPRTQQADSSVKEITIDENGLKLLRQRGIASGQWARVPEWDPTMERLGL